MIEFSLFLFLHFAQSKWLSSFLQVLHLMYKDTVRNTLEYFYGAFFQGAGGVYVHLYFHFKAYRDVLSKQCLFFSSQNSLDM